MSIYVDVLELILGVTWSGLTYSNIELKVCRGTKDQIKANWVMLFLTIFFAFFLLFCSISKAVASIAVGIFFGYMLVNLIMLNNSIREAFVHSRVQGKLRAYFKINDEKNKAMIKGMQQSLKHDRERISKMYSKEGRP